MLRRVAAPVDPVVRADPAARAVPAVPAALADLAVARALRAAPVDLVGLVDHVDLAGRAALAAPVARADPAVARALRADLAGRAALAAPVDRADRAGPAVPVDPAAHAAPAALTLRRLRHKSFSLGPARVKRSSRFPSLTSDASTRKSTDIRHSISSPNLAIRSIRCVPMRSFSTTYIRKAKRPLSTIPVCRDQVNSQYTSLRSYTCNAGCPCPFPCGPCGCKSGCSCLPPPCNTPPRCIQYMTGYYYYPYGTWFCGPYHVSGTCVPVPKPGCVPCGKCCACPCICPAATVFNPPGLGMPAQQGSFDASPSRRQGISRLFPNFPKPTGFNPRNPIPPIISSIVCDPYMTPNMNSQTTRPPISIPEEYEPKTSLPQWKVNASFGKKSLKSPICHKRFRQNYQCPQLDRPRVILTNNTWRKVIRGYSRRIFFGPASSPKEIKIKPNIKGHRLVPYSSMSAPCISIRTPGRFLIPPLKSRSAIFGTKKQSRQFTTCQNRCNSSPSAIQALSAAGSCSCLPPPCDCPPKCIQYMTGYYYYPYGTWFCGPYHVSGTCSPCSGPVTAGGPCGPGGPCPGSSCGPPGLGCKCGPCLPCCGCVFETGNTNNYGMWNHCAPSSCSMPGANNNGPIDVLGQFGSNHGASGSVSYGIPGQFHNGPVDVLGQFGSSFNPMGSDYHPGPVDFSGQFGPAYGYPHPLQPQYPQSNFYNQMPQYDSQGPCMGPCFNVPCEPTAVEPFIRPENFIPQATFPEYYQKQQQMEAPKPMKARCNAFPLLKKSDKSQNKDGKAAVVSSAAESFTSTTCPQNVKPKPMLGPLPFKFNRGK
ncbi:unnamed protein product [Leptosia nina]|uniref:Uncharacterized protein n=1 Tax=Leptosia nina TaxID=320188 RepID=A0AAV1K2K0_9NEOP